MKVKRRREPADNGRAFRPPHPMKFHALSALAFAAALVAFTAMDFAQTLPEAPVAPRVAKDVTVHGDRRIDDYFWMRDRDDPRTLPYLKAENAYAEAWFARRAALKEELYQEMFGRIQQDDDSVPFRKGDWWYSTRIFKGEQYAHHVRRRAVGADRRYDPNGSDETMLDLNEIARGKPFLSVGLSAVSPDAMRLAYSVDFTGGRDYTLHVRELARGADDAWSVAEVAAAAWGSDSRTLYYVTMDEAKRANRLWRRVIGGGPDTLLFEEKNELFGLDLHRTRDERYVLFSSESKDSNEIRVIDAGASPAAFAIDRKSVV